MSKLSINQKYKEHVINIALDTIAQNKQALVFVSSKSSAEKSAEIIAQKIQTINLKNLSDNILNTLPRPTKQCQRLSRCIQRGIAFHHSGLHYKQKELIEKEFREGTIKVIACTPTLAAGLDMPAFRTILKDVKRYSQTGYNFIPTLEYHQMAGRAGRPGKEDFGESIMIAKSKNDKEELIERFIRGSPEEIFSKLAVEPVLRTYTLSLISSGFVKTKQQLINFFSKTFWAFQFQDMNRLILIIEKMLNLLENYEFITSDQTSQQKNQTNSYLQTDFENASNLIKLKKNIESKNLNQDLTKDMTQDIKYLPTEVGKRVAELYIDPLTANHILECLSKNETPTDFALLQMISHTLEMRPLLRTRLKEFDAMQKLSNIKSDELLKPEPDIFEPEYEDYLDSIKTANFFYDWIDEQDEENLLEKYNTRPGEVHVKLNIIEWLLYSSSELANIANLKSTIKEINRLRFRLKHGIKKELIPLCKLKNVSKIRARKLFNNNIKDVRDIKKINIQTLIQILGPKMAYNIKEQVGQSLNPTDLEIKPTKRKGQMSLSKY